MLLATELPLAGRVAAAALVIRALQRRRRDRRRWYLLPPIGSDPQWYLSTGRHCRVLRRVTAGRLPGFGWLLRFEAGGAPGWVWIARQALDRRAERRLRAAITAGRT